LVGLAERETEHIRRLVVIQIAFVELMNRRVVHESDTDFSFADALAFQDRADDVSNLAAIDRHRLLGAGNGNANHGDFSEEGTAPGRAERREPLGSCWRMICQPPSAVCSRRAAITVGVCRITSLARAV